MTIKKIEKLFAVTLAFLCTGLAGWLYVVTREEDGTVVYRERLVTEEKAELPAVYDLREQKKAPAVKNQGELSTCWAVAASSALESALLPREKEVFAADHMSLQNSFSRKQSDGGDYTMVMAYLAGWQGPVLEAEDPYGDGISDESLTAVKHVQEMQVLQEKDYQSIKSAIYQYGAVQSSLYMDMDTAFSSSVYYNQINHSYLYPGEKKANHDILIIGWDDAYPAEKFNYQTKQDGAFICQNSWGTEFGEDGIFYVSYEDGSIGKNTICYTDIEDTDNYDHLYQTDLCGWVGQLGYGDGTCYFANLFQAERNEWLDAVGFYAVGPDTEYSVTVMDGEKDLTNALLEETKASGSFANAGYYTVNMKEPIYMEEGKTYAVVVKVHTPEADYPVATEYMADEATEEADLSDGDGYISHNGAKWTGTETEYGCNVCMKLYTTDEVKQ